MIYLGLALAFASGYVACLWRYDPDRLARWRDNFRATAIAARDLARQGRDAVRTWWAGRRG